MHRVYWSLIAILGLGIAHGSASAQAHFTARLTGAQEVPPVATAAQGSGAFTLTPAGLQYQITVEGLSAGMTAAHIHSAAPGANGGVVRNLAFHGNTAMGIWTASDAQPLTSALLTELARGNLYVNVHTTAHPGGEIRGQIALDTGVHLFATLTGAEENPPVVTPATGTATLTLNNEGLRYAITVTALSSARTAAHIHTGDIGVNGGVAFDLGPSFSGNTASGFIPRSSMTPAQIRDIVAGRTYINIHTTNNPGGEIRGQVLLSGGTGFHASLDGAQEVPPNGSAGRATAIFTLTPIGLQFDITASGLTGPITAAHFHNAPAGMNGGPVRGITSEFSGGTTASGLWRFDDTEALDANLLSELLEGNIYVNLHTAAHPGGEIRGQVLLQNGASATTLAARLTGSQEEPPVTTSARGTGVFSLGAGGLSYKITVDGLSSALSAAHFHGGPIGVNGGVLQAITFVGNTAEGVWPLTAAQATDLLLGRVYVNVHTVTNPGGEIRGQVLPASGADLHASMTGLQENPPTGSAGTGTGAFRMTSEGLVFHWTADGLTGAITAAHFHGGERGVNGGVVRGFSGGELSGNNCAGVWKPTDGSPLTPALEKSLLQGRVYVNLHTAAHPGGEIRGQVTLAGGSGRSTLLISGAEVPPVPSNGMGVLASVLTDRGLVFRTSVNDLTGVFSAAHFHNAPPGVNGGVVRDLGGDFVNLTADGVWSAADGQPLSTALIQQLLLGRIYINVHTTAFPGGEIRGNLAELTPASVDNGIEDGAVLRLANAPNPVSGRTVISFQLPEPGAVSLRVYDAAGREVSTVVRAVLDAGPHEAVFDGSGLGNGVYLYRLEAGDLTMTRKMLLVR